MQKREIATTANTTNTAGYSSKGFFRANIPVSNVQRDTHSRTQTRNETTSRKSPVHSNQRAWPQLIRTTEATIPTIDNDESSSEHNLQYEQSESDPNGTWSTSVISERTSRSPTCGEGAYKREANDIACKQQKSIISAGEIKSEYSTMADGKFDSDESDLQHSTRTVTDVKFDSEDSDSQHNVTSEIRDSVRRDIENAHQNAKRHVLTSFVKESAYYRNHMLPQNNC